MRKGQCIYFIFTFLYSFLLWPLPVVDPEPLSDMFSFIAKFFYGEGRLKVLANLIIFQFTAECKHCCHSKHCLVFYHKNYFKVSGEK